MSLKEYKRKRNFGATPEPSGDLASKGTGNQFVVQKHAASRLHYDFRLELDGTLRSWAVPKGPSLDPAVKSLAVQVEDHPLDYAEFEGVIPQGEYGGGTVMVWDRGTWKADGDGATDLKKGKLTFELFGEKLRGGWSLVQMKGRSGDDGKNWLLIKRNDKESRKSDILKTKPKSVLSGRDMARIAADADRVWTSSDAKKSGAKRRAKKNGLVSKVAASKNGATPKSRKRTTSAAKSPALKPSEVARIGGARKRTVPKDFKPQLAKLAAEAPAGDAWVHELKFDGYRILAFVDGKKVRLVTRNGNDWTHRFGAVARAIGELGLEGTLFDGEVVSINGDGISDFQQLQNLLKRGDESSLVYYVFDAPYLLGHDLTNAALTDRKEALARCLLGHAPKNDGVVRYSDHIAGRGESVLEQACRSAVEGIVSKRADSLYVQGRTAAWLKVKCLKRQEFVIGGFTEPSGSRVGFGALLLGYYDGDRFIYCGRVGTGFTSSSLRQLAGELKKRKTDSPPFDNPPTGSQRRGVTWVRPELVGEVEFTEWTDEGLLRHPSFQGLREDKPARQVGREEELKPAEVKREVARKIQVVEKGARGSAKKGAKVRLGAKSGRGATKSGDATVAGVRLTNPDRVLYPEQGLTKLALARFYESIADWVLPHLVGRPLTLVRCPDGRSGECFYQKHLTGSLPDAIRGVMIKEKAKSEEYVVIDDLGGLVSLVQMGVLEIHPWPARADQVERPDRLIFDFDPSEELKWAAVIEAARTLRDRLNALGLRSFPRTSGGKGLHVVVPLVRRNSWDELKAFAKAIADEMVAESPDRYIATMSKAKRRGKIFVDYLRNQRGATAIASYSTRAREGAPVATPITWDELRPRLKPNQYTVSNLGRRLRSLSGDPWEGFFEVEQSITARMLREVS